VFGLEPGGSFSEKVLYIYRKQIEEADLVVISKCDLIEDTRIDSLRRTIAAEFPRKEVMAVSSRQELNLNAWFDRLTSEEQLPQAAMNVDYQIYAEGEALLGWLNCTVQLSAEQPFDANRLLKQLAIEIQKRLQAQNAEVAHLKMTLNPDSGLGEIAAVNLVRNDFVPELSLELEEPVESAQLIINLRAEAAPAILETTVRDALATAIAASATLRFTLEHLEHFRPGKPVPTHRFTDIPV
jgi:G3E family GTPase